MTDQLHDDELFALIRKALPEVDGDTASPIGAQARAVLDRVISGDRRTVLDSHSFKEDDIVAGRNRRRRTRLILVASVCVVATAVAATVLVVTLISPRSVSPRLTTAQSPGVVMVRARLLAALNEASNDVVKVAGQKDVSSSDLTSCPATRWFYPFDVQPGGEFREHVEGDCGSDISNTAVDITVKTVTPFVLPTPASLARQTPAVHVSESDGVSVCGTGSFIGYYGRGPTGTTWQSVVETLRVPAPATPELIRSELQAGSFRLVGQTTIDGVPAIEMSLLSPPASQAGYTVSQELWVNPSTYLPIQEVTSYDPKSVPASEASGAHPATGDEVVQNFTFLPPTPTNLARLTVNIPHGLTRVPAGAALTTRSCAAPFAGGPTTRSSGRSNGTSTTANAV